MMLLDQTDRIVGVALAVIALLTAMVTWIRWARPRIHRAKATGAMALYSLVGRDEVRDPASGRVLAEAQPGIGARMEKVENSIARVADLLESQQRQDNRLNDHERRIQQLEEATIERIAGKAESVAAWRAVAAVAESGQLPPDDPELD